MQVKKKLKKRIIRVAVTLGFLVALGTTANITTPTDASSPIVSETGKQADNSEKTKTTKKETEEKSTKEKEQNSQENTEQTNITTESQQQEQTASSDTVEIETQAEVQPETQAETQPESPVDTSANHICEKDGYVDDYWVGQINYELETIPTSLVQQFQADGWHIYCTDMNIDAVYYGGQYGSVEASTNYDEYRIIIEDRQDAISDAAIHEFGHWYDWHLGTITNTDEFMNIYYAETESFRNTFGYRPYYDPMELFAEAFWKYLTNGQALQASCPMLYEFMSRYL